MQVLTVKYVAESLARLRKLGIHRSAIMGYLCVKRAAASQNTTEDVKVDFKEFFKHYLIVRDAPADKPYIMPFEPSNAKIWLNTNVSGSFAPSSIRQENPINTVITLNGSGSSVRYSLKQNHGEQAIKNLLNGIKLPVLDLAIFLYRDFGFNSNEMDAEKLLIIFKSEFGYLKDGKVSPDFDEIFSYSPELVPADLFAAFFQN